MALAGGFAMPETVGGGSIKVERMGLRLASDEEHGGTRVTAAFAGFECDVLLARPEGHESLSVVIPWSDRRFQCTTKDNTRPATGAVRWAGQEWTFDGAGHAFGCLDFGRGKWPYRTRWNWGSASGVQGGHTIGLQLGGKWTAGTGMTENALCVDGRLSKLSEELAWDYDRDDWMRPWRIRTPASSRVALDFAPVYEKRSRLELGIASSEAHQCFGTYSGTVVADGGDVISIDDFFGWAEEARWRW
jgi:hypothetical protein